MCVFLGKKKRKKKKKGVFLVFKVLGGQFSRIEKSFLVRQDIGYGVEFRKLDLGRYFLERVRFIYLFMQYVFIEYLLYVQYGLVIEMDRILVFLELIVKGIIKLNEINVFGSRVGFFQVVFFEIFIVFFY